MHLLHPKNHRLWGLSTGFVFWTCYCNELWLSLQWNSDCVVLVLFLTMDNFVKIVFDYSLKIKEKAKVWRNRKFKIQTQLTNLTTNNSLDVTAILWEVSLLRLLNYRMLIQGDNTLLLIKTFSNTHVQISTHLTLSQKLSFFQQNCQWQFWWKKWQFLAIFFFKCQV